MTPFGFLAELVMLLATVGFIICLRMLASPKTARIGNAVGSVAMLLTVVAAFMMAKPNTYIGILIAILFGSAVGVYAARKVKMTAMPEMVALFNGFGGAASVLVAMSEMMRKLPELANTPDIQFTLTSWFGVLVGAITFTGSIVAFLKLQGLMPSRPILLPGQRFLTVGLLAFSLGAAVFLVYTPDSLNMFVLVTATSSLLGILLVTPIGGADMPVVISLLNSYSGVAAMAAGFVVQSHVLVISGALVGASGIILTRIMCQAMNRSLLNVIFGAFGDVAVGGVNDDKPCREFLPIDAAMMLANAGKVIVVPGYGLAVSQGQQTIRELADALAEKGASIKYAIHPVAGRMPGHMNVLLAEADVSYDDMKDIDEVNSEFETADVALIVGANDVVNPSARDDKTNPLFGMPILNADRARTVIVFKRGKGRGFAGVENPLFSLDNAGVVYGDAKKSLMAVIKEVKELS